MYTLICIWVIHHCYVNISEIRIFKFLLWKNKYIYTLMIWRTLFSNHEVRILLLQSWGNKKAYLSLVSYFSICWLIYYVINGFIPRLLSSNVHSLLRKNAPPIEYFRHTYFKYGRLEYSLPVDVRLRVPTARRHGNDAFGVRDHAVPRLDVRTVEL